MQRQILPVIKLQEIYLAAGANSMQRQISTAIKLKMKKKFVLRIDDDVYQALEKWAADEFRSVNGQIEWILSEKLKEIKRLKKNSIVKPDEEKEKE